MPRRYAKSRARRTNRRRRGGGRRRTRGGAGSFSKRVLAVVRKTREVKIARGSGTRSFSDEIISNADLTNFFPGVRQGTAKNERIGSEITVRKLVLKMWFQFVPDANGTTDPDDGNISARMFCIRQKNCARDSTLINNAAADDPHFQNEKLLVPVAGTANSGGFFAANGFNNIMAPLNRDLFVSKMDKRFDFRNNQLYAGQASNAPVLAPSNFRKMTKVFNYKSGKKFEYMVNTSTEPQAWPWVLTAGYVNTNGTTTTPGRMVLNYTTTMYYTDA